MSLKTKRKDNQMILQKLNSLKAQILQMLNTQAILRKSFYNQTTIHLKQKMIANNKIIFKIRSKNLRLKLMTKIPKAIKIFYLMKIKWS